MERWEALLKALENSRFLLPEEDPELFNLQLTAERCHAWVADSGKQYHYKTQHAIFENMQSCGINKVSGCITIKPRRQEKLGRWSSRGISEEAYIALPESNSAAELGAALRLAFSRCQ